MKAMLSGLSLLFALAACKAEHPVDAATPADRPVADQPAVDPPAAAVPPAAQPAPAAPTPPPSGPMPAPGAITFAGFGPARFGASEEEVRMAWGKDMQADPADTPDACHYLYPLPRPHAGFRLAFMIEGGKFARIDVDTIDILAPGGGRVGLELEQIRSLYADRIEARPHKYVEGGQYLRIKDPEGGAGVLVFNVVDGAVTAWRIGVPPQVDYVEGCA